MQPEIHLGPLDLQTFGICFAFAFLASGALFATRLRELGKPPDWTYEAIFAALIGGLVGSRLDFLIQNWDEVSGDLFGNVFSGSGLVWFGGLVGGALGGWRDRFAPGFLFGLYLILAGIERFLVEFIRRNDAVAAGLTLAQLVSLAMVAGGAALVLARRNAPRAATA